MTKRRKGRTFRKKMRGGQEENKVSFLPIDISKTGKMSESPLGKETTFGETSPIVDISKIRGQAPPKPTLEQVDEVTLTKDDIMGGKLRRTRKRRMSKRKRNIKKNRKSKSKKMRGGAFTDYLPSWMTGKKEEQQVPVPKYDNITTFSPEYEQQMKENMEKYNQQQSQSQQ
jgi:hypothetical protein